MKLAVISDVHGNLEALLRVFEDMDECGVKDCVCLGDCIGYGPEPDAVLNLVRERSIPMVMGNHEVALFDDDYLEWFNELASQSILITRKIISIENQDYCRSLPPNLELHDSLFVHGVPPDSILTYIIELNDYELSNLFAQMQHKICFVGHTHLLEVISYKKGGIDHEPVFNPVLTLEEDSKYIINIGSVGQPRDHISREAKYVIWDTEKNTVEFRFVSYDVSITVDRILERGMPSFHARRLW